MKRIVLLVAMFMIGAAWGRAAQFDPKWRERWSPEAIEVLSRVPIQDGGRIKPLSTFAIFELVRVNGRMRYNPEEGRPVPAMAWLLDCLFYPEIGARYPVILIENPQIMQAIGLDDTDKRARFSITDLEPLGERMFDYARRISEKPKEARDIFDQQMLDVYDRYATVQSLLHAMDFARFHREVPAGSALANSLDIAGIRSHGEGNFHFRYSDALANLPKLVAIYQLQQQQAGRGADPTSIAGFISALENAARNSTALTVFAPVGDRHREEWYSPGTLLETMLVDNLRHEREWGSLVALESLADSARSPETFDAAAATAYSRLQSAAAERGQYEKIDLEIFFYKFRPFYWSLVFFVLSLLIVALTWAAPRSRGLGTAAFISVALPTVLLIVGITLRCIIRGRPPVTTLYETTLFIPAVAIVVALVAEWISRKRIALSVASGLGCLGMFLAHNYELRGPDTMESMIAVLNSNFWLSTHVTTVNIGYAAGLLAAAAAHVYIFGRLFGAGRRNPDLLRTTARITYGVLCFGLLFAFTGTVLGGIWANYSWGRFWGWDPKENGALLIILWNLFILHARLGGYLRDLGIAIAAVFGGIIVAFSWWGVNLLGVGLHAYGFLSGVQGRLNVFYLIEAAVILVGIFVALRDKALKSAPAEPDRPPMALEPAP